MWYYRFMKLGKKKEEAPEPQQQLPEEKAPQGHGQTIFVVEDEQSLLNIYKDVLEKAGYKVVAVDNSEEALKKINTVQWDLLILDVVLPRADGFEVAKSIKEKGGRKVVILSNLGRGSMMREGYEAGVDDYWVKVDVTPDVLLKKVGEIFSNYRI